MLKKKSDKADTWIKYIKKYQVQDCQQSNIIISTCNSGPESESEPDTIYPDIYTGTCKSANLECERGQEFH